MNSGTHRNRHARSAVIATLVPALAVFAGGCQTVKPWERGTLADPIMQADRDPLCRSLVEHVYFSREAAAGGRGVAGAGCGCN